MKDKEKYSIVTDSEAGNSMTICPGCEDLHEAEKARVKYNVDETRVRLRVCLACVGILIRGEELPNGDVVGLAKNSKRNK